MEKQEVKKMVDDFLNDVREPLERGLADGSIEPSEINAVLQEIQKAEGLPALGRRIHKIAKGDSSDDELEALGADIAEIANS